MTLADERQGFSKRLRDAIREAGINAGSPTRVAREFNLRYHGEAVSPQAVRKWLAGKALPSQDKIRVLGLWLGVSAHWLRFGETDKREERPSLAARQESGAYRLDHGWPSKKFELLNDAHKRMVVEIVHALLRLEGKQ
jgi:hypothetical protein